MRRTITATLLAAALLLGTAGGAVAASSYPTTLSISYSRTSGDFSGTLRSHSGCIGGRKVTVYRQSPGNDPAVASGKSAASGKWRAAGGGVKKGDYYAKTPAYSGSAGRCAPAKSPATHVS
jgi:hypothetical protein